MKKNVGKTDKTIRIVAGLLILGIGLAKGSMWGLVGLVPLATAFIGFCPAYPLFGMNTCKTDSAGSCCCGGKEEEKKSAQG
jgi:hypothetical protein